VVIRLAGSNDHKHGHHEVNDAHDIPKHMPSAGCEERVANQPEYDPRRDEPNGHVTESGRESKQARQNAMGIE
jgi:hypothetical protein